MPRSSLTQNETASVGSDHEHTAEEAHQGKKPVIRRETADNDRDGAQGDHD